MTMNSRDAARTLFNIDGAGYFSKNLLVKYKSD